MTIIATLTALQLEQAARRWVDTKYQDQQSQRGVACDCVGLFVGLGRDLGVEIISEADYPARPNGARMLRYLTANCTRLDPMSLELTVPGMVLAFKMRDDDEGPHHLALRTTRGMLHATPPWVMEHGLRWADRLHSVWWHPEVAWAS